MKKIGITGPIASGKTTAAILIRRRGFPVFNCDSYARLIRKPGNEVFEGLLTMFGEDICEANGYIDSRKLAEVIFNDEQARRQVNGLAHPFIKKAMERFFQTNAELPLVFAEVPLLFEAGWKSFFDEIMVVVCAKEKALTRMEQERGYSEKEAMARYESQIDPAYQIEHADYVVYNDGTIKDLDQAINKYIAAKRKEERNGD